MTSDARIANYTARATAVGLVLSVEGSWFRLTLSDELLILSMQFYKVRMRVRYYEKQINASPGGVRNERQGA